MLASGETEHLSSLLEPILDEAPAGEDLRLEEAHDGLYSRLRDARLEARAAERLADNDPDLGDAAPPQWSTVRELALEALATRSKDVEIACWLTESLTRHDGLAGLAAGAGLIAGLVERYWDAGLHPAAEQDDPEGRLLALTGLSGRDRDGSLMQPLRKTELFARADGASPVTLWSFERSMSVAALGVEAGKAQRVPDTVAPFADLEAEARGPGRGRAGAPRGSVLPGQPRAVADDGSRDCGRHACRGAGRRPLCRRWGVRPRRSAARHGLGDLRGR